MKRGLVLGMLAALAASAPAGAQVPAALPWPAADVDSRTRAEGRGADQARNPAYQAAAQNGGGTEGGIDVDPFRRDWHLTRGMRERVTFVNRYGAKLAGHLYRSRRAGKRRLPAIVVLPGFGDPTIELDLHRNYEPVVQQLAENGYVVLAVDPQAQGLSANDADSRYCGAAGWWREPQEAGLVERGACAGQDPPSAYWYAHPLMAELMAPLQGTPAFVVGDLALFAVSMKLDPQGFRDSLRDGYDAFRPRFTFAGIDAGKWLVSGENPWRDRIDPKRVGIAGHSAGADGAVVAGNASKLFKAVVAWDTYGSPPETMPVRVPTMLQQSEQPQFMSPWGATPPDPRFWPSYRLADRFAGAGVPHAVVALRGATHQEWQWVANALACPLCNASSTGQQVGTYFTVAWFDRFLKGDKARRLTASRFDDTADRTSIGTGRFDAVTQQNVPYRIAGERVSDHLSRLYASVFAP
jgi:dienelactone hydrolase